MVDFTFYCSCFTRPNDNMTLKSPGMLNAATPYAKIRVHKEEQHEAITLLLPQMSCRKLRVTRIHCTFIWSHLHKGGSILGVYTPFTMA